MEKSKRPRPVKRLVIMLLVAGVVLFTVSLLIYGRDRIFRRAHYQCIYVGSESSVYSKHARCVTVDDRGGCYGYYYLLGSDIRQGIDVREGNPLTVTCEGLTAFDYHFMDKNGNYLWTSHSVEDIF